MELTVKTERRSKPRLYGTYPATVRGVGHDGEKFETNAVLENISAGGLYLRFRQRVEPGENLFLVTRLGGNGGKSSAEVRGPLIAINGLVLRIETKPGGENGAAVAITGYQFL